MKRRQWKVEDRRFVLPDGATMVAGCHHSGKSTSACGGCYARLAALMREIEKDPSEALDILTEVSEELRWEGQQEKKRRPKP